MKKTCESLIKKEIEMNGDEHKYERYDKEWR